jgi:serine phosphatase RsbU (regulator of sigma subunit)
MTEAPIEVGIAQLTLPGEAECGDRCVVKISENRVLIAVIDGVGHGAEAALAAQAAADVIAEYSREPLGALMTRCHERLQRTRGAAIILMSIDVAARQLDWLGAGNVAAVLLHSNSSGMPGRKELLVRSGVAGARLPSTTTSTVPITRGDVVTLATDGVRHGFVDGIDYGIPPQKLAEQLLAQYQTARDDALVVVGRIVR